MGQGWAVSPTRHMLTNHPPSACGEKGTRKELVGGGVLEFFPWMWAKGPLSVFIFLPDPGFSTWFRWKKYLAYRVIGTEVDLLTRGEKTSKKKAVLLIFTHWRPYKMLIYFHMNVRLIECVCPISMCIRITSLLTIRFQRSNARVSDSVNPEWSQESVI